MTDDIPQSRDPHGMGGPAGPKRAGLTNRHRGTGRARLFHPMGRAGLSFICNGPKRANLVDSKTAMYRLFSYFSSKLRLSRFVCKIWRGRGMFEVQNQIGSCRLSCKQYDYIKYINIGIAFKWSCMYYMQVYGLNPYYVLLSCIVVSSVVS